MRKVLCQKRWREIVEMQSHEEGFVPQMLREIVETAKSQGRAILGVALGLHNLSCCGRVWPTWRVWVGCWRRWWRRCVTRPSSWRPSCPSTASRRQRRFCGGSPWAWTTTPTAWQGWARVTATLCWPHTWVTGWRWGGKWREGSGGNQQCHTGVTGWWWGGKWREGSGGKPTVSHRSYRMVVRGEMERGKWGETNSVAQELQDGGEGGNGEREMGGNQQCHTGVTGWWWGGKWREGSGGKPTVSHRSYRMVVRGEMERGKWGPTVSHRSYRMEVRGEMEWGKWGETNSVTQELQDGGEGGNGEREVGGNQQCHTGVTGWWWGGKWREGSGGKPTVSHRS